MKIETIFEKIIKSLFIIGWGLMLLFFIWYAGKYGITEFIIKNPTKIESILNILIWGTLTLTINNNFWDEIKK
jgi:hypothetical protein